MSLTPQQCEQFTHEGYLVVKGLLNGFEPLQRLREEISGLGRTFSPSFALDDHAWMGDMPEGDRATFYRGLRYLPSLAALGASDRMLGAGSALGLRFPALMRSFNVRMDLPNRDQFLFHWHQDITYLLGSLNSVTAWCPLGPSDRQHGSIEVVPGSHRALAPFRFTSEEARNKTAQLSPSDIRLVAEPETATLIEDVDCGDVVLFSQFLLHRSTPNRSAACRWTAQLRYADLLEPEFRSAGFPFGDMTTIARVSYLDPVAPGTT